MIDPEEAVPESVEATKPDPPPPPIVPKPPPKQPILPHEVC